MSDLSQKSCVPCMGGVPPLCGEDIAPLFKQLRDWQVVKEHHLTKNYEFPDFVSALEWVNQVGQIAEAEGHHPDIFLSWGKVRIEIWTHKVDGLSESDFILAAKLDAKK